MHSEEVIIVCRQAVYMCSLQRAYHRVPRIDDKTCPACTPQQTGFPG